MKPSAKSKLPKLKKNQIQLIASGDLRLSANQVCWPAQKAMEDTLSAAIQSEGYEVVRAHAYDAATKHGFIDSQRRLVRDYEQTETSAAAMVHLAMIHIMLRRLA